MFGYQRLCEITGITKNEMRALINLNGLPSKGLIKIVPKKGMKILTIILLMT
ncbi:hypothetical protein [Clostridium perfringens]|uniref:hypothetical protein n=1 Tax=Clostridium perfringens TaxID=1502 RepID=UPI001A339AF3|nr:hypothetical protein [Clostridium perfringens]HAT4244520.1 hypothetical protein [Clostridium perfringens]